jgi:hypothetical protein
MKDYCTLKAPVVRVQARMYIFWKIDIFGFLESDDNDKNATKMLRKAYGNHESCR